MVAGDPSDWLEYRRADAIRRSHPDGDRVHLLGTSDAATLLCAADAFVLDSFFEGWPLAATEAVSAGLPLVISEAGGAAELVARAAPGSTLVSNASGAAAEVTDRRAAAARRRAATSDERGGRSRPRWRTSPQTVRAQGRSGPPADDSFAAMVAGHAAVARAAVARRTDASPHGRVGR